MPKVKVFERIVIDKETGEVLENSVKYKEKYKKERYTMLRLTEGISWMLKFTGNEMTLLVLLLEYERPDTNAIAITPEIRQSIVTFFGKSDRYVRSLFAALDKKDAIRKCSDTMIVINPIYFYKGSSYNLQTLIDGWNITKHSVDVNRSKLGNK